MHRQRFGTDPPPLDLGDAAALATASLDEVAADLLRELDADESFSRHNLLSSSLGHSRGPRASITCSYSPRRGSGSSMPDSCARRR